MKSRSRRAAQGAKKSSRGAAAVEFAIILPIVIGLVFGIVEAGWALEQKHGARSNAQVFARIAAINFAEASISDMDAVLAEMCTELDLRDDALVTVELPDGADTGDRVVVTIEEDLEQVTGMFDPILGGKQVTGVATAQLEQDAAYSGIAGTQCDGTVVVTPTATPVAGPTPTPNPAATATPTPSPTPVAGTCTVPDFVGVRRNAAEAIWQTAGFTGTMTFQSGTGNYFIAVQTLSAAASQPCSANITVGP